jgi:VIT1/CCC1 family predicted Fe2+/Mn2+ transporter
MSMATGEYVSVSSQADTERADLAREKQELAANPMSERDELAQIYITRGLDSRLAQEVAAQLMSHDALKSHARDELGITEGRRARPIQAAFASAASFFAGAVLPLVVVVLAPPERLIPWVAAASLLFLVLLGGLAARTGGAAVGKGALRVAFWSAAAMGATALIGRLFGTALQ